MSDRPALHIVPRPMARRSHRKISRRACQLFVELCGRLEAGTYEYDDHWFSLQVELGIHHWGRMVGPHDITEQEPGYLRWNELRRQDWHAVRKLRDELEARTGRKVLPRPEE
jgi:hypothetical protein